MAPISSGIADWIRTTTIEALPPEVVQNAKLRMLDLLGVMVATRSNDVVLAASRAVTASDGGSGASPVAFEQSMSVSGAAFINGILASLIEFDDSFLPTAIHASGLCNSVMFPACEVQQVSGKRLIEACTIGSELMIRSSIVSPMPWYWFDHGLHPTGVFAVFGGTAALSKLRGLSHAEIVSAFGHAGSMSAGLTASFEDGTSTKTLHIGLGAANSFRAVALAQAGVTGPAKVFEGKFGWYRSHLQTTDVRHYHHLTELPGKEWRVLEIVPKLYPVAYSLVPHIEAAIAVRNVYHVEPEDVARIDAYIPEVTFKNLCEPRDAKIKPSSSWHGRISLQHTIAEALSVGKMDKNAFTLSNIRDPRINELASKVFHHADPNHHPDRLSAKLVITKTDGAVLTHEIGDCRGTKTNPLRVEDYVKKFHANTGDVLPGHVIEQTVQDFLNLESVEDTSKTLARLRG